MDFDRICKYVSLGDEKEFIRCLELGDLDTILMPFSEIGVQQEDHEVLIPPPPLIH